MVLALLGGLINVVDMPTRQAFAVEMVGREDIGNAVALNSAMFNAARVLGPAVAGLTIGAFDISTAFFIDGISFLAVLVAPPRDAPERAAGRAPDRPADVRPRGRPRPRARGCPTSAARRWCCSAILVVGLVATFGMNFQVVDPAADRARCCTPTPPATAS